MVVIEESVFVFVVIVGVKVMGCFFLVKDGIYLFIVMFLVVLKD